MTEVQPVRAADRLSAAEIDDVLALADAAAQADGVYPLSEDVVLCIRNGGAGVHLRTSAGYAFLEDGAGELVVHPAHRRQGHGTALLGAIGPTELRIWAHGDDPGARAFAEHNGFTRDRVLWQMRRSLLDPLPDVPLPAGVTIRGFRPGFDEQGWVEVNAKAFAQHPEQGRWTLDDLLVREAEPWFDPAGFLLAVDIADSLLGFHWTKVHPPAGLDPALGEIYVLGVEPSGHQRGLGAALSVAGLRHLAAAGLEWASLYVDESNEAAVKLYRRLGFEVHSADINYHRG
ncbi:mycothiol synthase [Actinoplanes regularis]|uniref:Mycothiol acetyltransferase n=1 Tax=Actinoplanes regularis TaxID=52697 RepID=A0A239G8S4_9ACTN|nr:mycothiol synthase [Actinoplanes regularis]GIE90399.1 mycothiol acetyltransferase [Actinoplanes regularis]SNS65481.1 mycothiol synthase [Actinoplanes regularis]